MLLLETIRRQFDDALSTLAADRGELLKRITATRDAQFGDYQANLALVMALGKQLGRDPVELANSIADRLRQSPLLTTVDVAGKGFINVRIRDDVIIEWLRQLDQSPDLTVTKPTHPRTVIVDYSSPNVAKPMHVGHIRSTVIGDAIVRTLRFLGHRVISDNHLGDWGTQFGMIIYGYKHFSKPDQYDADPVAELSRVYRVIQQIIGYQEAKETLASKVAAVADAEQQLAHAKASLQAVALKSPDEKKWSKQAKSLERALVEAEEQVRGALSKIEAVEGDPDLSAFASLHSQLESRVLHETAKLHAGDEENLALWNKFLPHCRDEIQTVYNRLDVTFDYELGESFYHDMLGPTVESLLERGIAVESQGAVCVFLDGFDAPMIVRKQDGAYLYATTDLATVDYRMKKFQPDAMLYVVDHRQGDHFKKLFACLAKMGLTNVELKHVSFGTVLGKDGKPFKTRAGTIVGLESLLDEAESRALSVVCNPERLQKASLELTDDEKRHVARVVGLGAIKYADLSHHRENDYEYDLEKMVQLEGNTAAYIQYSYARTQNILKKLDESHQSAALVNGVDAELRFEHPLERSLAMQLVRFEDTLQSSMQDYLPSVLTEYLYELAKLFASFFDQCPVLRAETDSQRATRRLLVVLTGKTIRQGLQLLSIQTIDRM